VSTIAVVPVKRWQDAKQRLEDDLSPGERRALAEAMLIDVLVALRRADRVHRVIVVTGEPAAVAIAHGHDADPLDDPRDAGQSPAATLGVREAIARGATRVLLLAGDCPAVEPGEIDGLVLGAGRAPEVVLVPDRHGTGTNALLLTPPGAIEPAFGPGSRERHVSAAQTAQAACRVDEIPSIMHDVDTIDDLEALRTLLAGMRGNAAHTRGLLSRWAKR
jgi:2-phospho-L-lactate guanylyltransferase